jgi:uncharacterized protein DUF222/HNH endonuclease
VSKSGKPFDESQYQASAGPALIAALQDISRQIRVLEAARLDTIAEVYRLGIAALAGYSNTRALLIEVLRVAPRLATKLVQRSAVVAETLTPTGHVTPAPLPTVRAALHEGLLDGEHIDAVADTIKEIPDTADYATRELVESTLAETARTVNPKVVAEHGAIMLQHLDPDGLEPGEEPPPQPMNSLTCRRNRDGSLKFAGQLDPESADLLEQMLVTWGKPRRLSDDLPDPRSVRERHGDALSEIVHRAANPKGVTKARLTVTLDHEILLHGIGTATLSSGCPLTPKAVRRLACDAGIIPVVLNGKSVPLDVGRSRRLVKPSQRAALVARDQGCAYPGCCQAAQYTDAHHIRHWADGGATDLDNLVLLCRLHHLMLHHSAWTVRIRGGLPEFIPPKWIDPQQKPIRNTIRLQQ